MNNLQYIAKAEQRNLSESFSSIYPSSNLNASRRNLLVNSSAVRNYANASPEQNDSMIIGNNTPQELEIQRKKLAKQLVKFEINSRNNRHSNKRNTEVNMVPSKLDISRNSVNTIDINQQDPITLDISHKPKSKFKNQMSLNIKPRLISEQESNSTIINDKHFNTNMDGKMYTVSQDLCGVCGQPFENHAMEYNFDLVMLHLKYMDVIENTSNDDRLLTMKRPGSAVSIKSIQSMIKNNQMRTIDHNNSRSK